jgi:hypothetical protein
MGAADRLVTAYIEGLGLAAVWLGRMPDGSIHVGTSLDHDPTPRPQAEMIAELWLAKPLHAEVLAEAAAGAADLAALREIADDLGILAVTRDEATAIATAAVAVIQAEIARAKLAGELRALNRAYKKCRLESEAAGRKFQKYDQWLAAWELGVVRAAAEAAKASPAGALAYVARPDLRALRLSEPVAAALAAEPARVAIGHHGLAGVTAARTA